MDNFYCIGLDLSSSHFGMVIMEADGKLDEDIPWKAIVPLKKQEIDDFSCRVPQRKKGESKNNFDARRRDFMFCAFEMLYRDCCLEYLIPVFINIEDYAYNAKNSQGMTGIAEITGIIKQYLYDGDVPLRLTAPTKLKKFATGRGNAGKRVMIESIDKNRFDIPKKLYAYDAQGNLEGPATDLADAFWLAEILRVEMLIREGRMKLEDLNVKQQEALTEVLHEPLIV